MAYKTWTLDDFSGGIDLLSSDGDRSANSALGRKGTSDGSRNFAIGEQGRLKVGGEFIPLDDLAEDLGTAGDGTVVEITGHIQERTWQPPEGQKRTFTDAVVTNFVQAETA